MNRPGRDMDRWLGDGGMAIIAVVGGAFTGYGVDGEDLGWVVGTFTPTDLACNPHGITQAGIHSLLLDAAMNFAINAALPGKARTRGTLEIKTECMRPALQGDDVSAARRGRAPGQAGGLRRGDGPDSRRRAREPGHRDLSPASTRARRGGRRPHLTPTGSRRPALGSAASAAARPHPAQATCFACRWVGRRLGRSLAPVFPVRLCPLPSPLYTVLLGYKESPVSEARRRFAPLLRRSRPPSSAVTPSVSRRRPAGRSTSCARSRRRRGRRAHPSRPWTDSVARWVT